MVAISPRRKDRRHGTGLSAVDRALNSPVSQAVREAAATDRAFGAAMPACRAKWVAATVCTPQVTREASLVTGDRDPMACCPLPVSATGAGGRLQQGIAPESCTLTSVAHPQLHIRHAVQRQKHGTVLHLAACSVTHTANAEVVQCLNASSNKGNGQASRPSKSWLVVSAAQVGYRPFSQRACASRQAARTLRLSRSCFWGGAHHAPRHDPRAGSRAPV